MNLSMYSVNWVRNVAVGNFDGNAAGREQFIFTVWRKYSGEGRYASLVGVLTGVEFNKDKLD